MADEPDTSEAERVAERAGHATPEPGEMSDEELSVVVEQLPGEGDDGDAE